MSPLSRPRSGTRPTSARPAARGRTGRVRRSPIAALAGLVLAAGFVLGACSPAFDPTGPCTADGSAAGAYPDLEASVPKQFNGSPPAELDSGRACTSAGLGTLTGHGIGELRFAGGTWSTGTQSGLSLAVFTAAAGPALDPAWLAEFYETGARAGKNVTSLETSDYPLSSTVVARKIDVLNNESYQSVVVWQRGDRIAVALVASFIREIETKAAHDAVVRQAVDAFGG